MSSNIIRQIQKRLAKRMGFHRNRVTGKIVDFNGDPVPGNRWPSINHPTNEQGTCYLARTAREEKRRSKKEKVTA